MKRNLRSTSDLMSNLPSNVTENILKGLPLRDAVRTSVLSSKWRYTWVTIPQLVFNRRFFLKCLDNEKLKAVIYQVLLFHQGPLVKFNLHYPPFESCLDINNWIFILSKKNIQKFSLCLRGGPHHAIPCHLFSLPQLRYLTLTSCILKPPPTFKGFSKLVSLQLFYCIISPEMFGWLISNCPLLERLIWHDRTEFHSLDINGPNLRYFDFTGIFESISFRNTPLLAKISIALLSWNAKDIDEAEIESRWVKFFHSLPAIEDVQLDSSFLSFAAGDVPERLPSSLNQLKVLALSDFCYSDLDHVSWALCLLRSSPNLHKFHSSILKITPIKDDVTDFLQAQDFSNFSLNQLRNVEIRHFSGAEPEMLFVKILLAHSMVLEKLVILYERDTDDEKRFEMVKELTRFPRASSKAEIVVDVTPGLVEVEPSW